MLKPDLLAVGLIAFLVTPAIAAEEFFVVQNPKTHACEVSNKKATEHTN